VGGDEWSPSAARVRHGRRSAGAVRVTGAPQRHEAERDARRERDARKHALSR
jgi:hypothetical protein